MCPVRFTCWLLASSLIIGCACPRPRGDATAMTPSDRTLITAEFRDTSARIVLDCISRMAGREVVVESGIEDRITIVLQDCPWDAAVRVAADLARCEAREASGRVVVGRPNRVTVEFAQTDLVEAVRMITSGSGVEVAIDEGVHAAVSMSLVNAPWRDALEAVARSADCALLQQNHGPRLLVTMSGGRLPLTMEARVFKFSFVKPLKGVRARITITGGVRGGQPVGDPAKGFTLLDALRCMLTRMPGRPHEERSLGRLDYFKDGNCIIVVDTPETLDRIERALRDVDVAANQ